uniref:Uncharacterized protein n=1 Tax=Onchocerca volvulus TaxID=6282 RepID=A0A8R1XME1_ONCVO
MAAMRVGDNGTILHFEEGMQFTTNLTVLYRHCNLRHRNDIRFEIYFYIIHPKKDDAITSRLIRTLPELKKQCEHLLPEVTHLTSNEILRDLIIQDYNHLSCTISLSEGFGFVKSPNDQKAAVL